MSANNYCLIHKVKSKWCVWLDLNAEEAMENPVLSIKQAKRFKTLEEAVEWTNNHDYSEYGYQINKLGKPKDGFLEKIVEL